MAAHDYITLLLGDQNKGWCEDCWVSYHRSNDGFYFSTLAYFKLDARKTFGQCMVPPPDILYSVDIRRGARVGIPEGTKIQTNPGLTVYEVQKVGPECIG